MKNDYINNENRDGWDDLYDECFEEINEIINDNLQRIHNEELIKRVFLKMLTALDKANLRMKKIEGEEEKKEPWFEKSKNIKDFANQADTLNKKVITINLIDQFLRSTY